MTAARPDESSGSGPPVERVMLGNVPLDRVGAARAVELIAGWRGAAPFRLVVTANVDHVMILQRDAAFREVYAGAALALLDGHPLLWGARWLGLPPLEKVPGSDLVPALCARGAAERWRVFVAAGRDAAELHATLQGLARRHPGLVLEGLAPAWGFEREDAESERLLAAIARFGPDLLLMGCGSPKSEVWMARHAARLGRGVGISVGAALRFAAGIERRAPRAMQRAGLEWLWRLAREPRRLWRRYVVEDAQFFPLLWRWRRRQKRAMRQRRRLPGSE